MKKILVWILFILSIGFWIIFADALYPDSADIGVKSSIIQWEATNLSITMMKNWSQMTTYTGMIYITIQKEDSWEILNNNEFVLPSDWIYKFKNSDLWSIEFQKWLEIKKEWKFRIEVADFENDYVFWTKSITVVKDSSQQSVSNISIVTPAQDDVIIDEKLNIIAQAELKNSGVLIYIDDQVTNNTTTDQDWFINYSISGIEPWKHTLRIEISDIDGSVLSKSDSINFNYTPQQTQLFKEIKVEPEEWLTVWDIIDISVLTDELAESVEIRLSDRNENDWIIMRKDSVWHFSQNVYIESWGTINISLDITSRNNSNISTYNNVKQIHVDEIPNVSNIKIETDAEQQIANISREASNAASSFLVEYWTEESNLFLSEETNTKSFIFTEVPYDTSIYFRIIPYINNSTRHWSATETRRFIITKPSETIPIINTWSAQIPSVIQEDNTQLHTPKCSVQNIATRTRKIWDSYYLVRDSVENVSKYIVYSSTNSSWTDKTKIYETTDTSYEYPFDHTLEEDKFMYFRIVWICDDWEELQLTWATKVQVWPTQNFLLLMCLTLLIYFWIKLFRQTE